MVKLVSISVFGGNSKFLVTEKRFQERENFLLLLKLHKRLVRQKGSQVRIQCSILFLLNQSFLSSQVLFAWRWPERCKSTISIGGKVLNWKEGTCLHQRISKNFLPGSMFVVLVLDGVIWSQNSNVFNSFWPTQSQQSHLPVFYSW